MSIRFAKLLQRLAEDSRKGNLILRIPVCSDVNCATLAHFSAFWRPDGVRNYKRALADILNGELDGNRVTNSKGLAVVGFSVHDWDDKIAAPKDGSETESNMLHETLVGFVSEYELISEEQNPCGIGVLQSDGRMNNKGRHISLRILRKKSDAEYSEFATGPQRVTRTVLAEQYPEHCIALPREAGR